jgi:sulfur carrier protein
MRIVLNGQSLDVTAPTLRDLLTERGLATAKIATALNGEFVAAPLRAETPLREGDRVEILSPMQGG